MECKDESLRFATDELAYNKKEKESEYASRQAKNKEDECTLYAVRSHARTPTASPSSCRGRCYSGSSTVQRFKSTQTGQKTYNSWMAHGDEKRSPLQLKGSRNVYQKLKWVSSTFAHAWLYRCDYDDVYPPFAINKTCTSCACYMHIMFMQALDKNHSASNNSGSSSSSSNDDETNESNALFKRISILYWSLSTIYIHSKSAGAGFIRLLLGRR
ncbi:unnamed protein product [Trichogramma brassicae]|uniref:Uncharacterized protein n=1 Tax=Trichogramma brassicae TaxID=86971 RepID=A0A6H5IF19_9HYME|nr:unnamed protein product [Trichogramma brassicae]